MAEKMYKKQGVPKGADPATHERCVRDVKAKGHDKSSAYAICNAAGAGKKGKKKMKKSKEEFAEELKKSLLKEYEGKEITEEVKAEIQDKIAKALQAGYDVVEPAEEVKEVDPTAPTEAQIQAKTEEAAAKEEEKVEEPASEEAAAAAEAAEPAKEEAKSDPKFAGNLFKPYSLGATLQQGPTGNVMQGVKKPSMDYVEVEKNSIRQTTMTKKDFENKSE